MESTGEKTKSEDDVRSVPPGNDAILESPIEKSEEQEEEDDGKDGKYADPESSGVADGPKGKTFMEAAGSKALRPFVIISSSYLLFTITDGALRMIVLLHAYNKNFSALEVAIMFTLYELAGVFTNLVGRKEISMVTIDTGRVYYISHFQ
jgi:hypothetical protein